MANTYDIGTKATGLDRRLRRDLAGLYSKYKDIQILTLDPVTAFFNTNNAGEMDMFGLEAEIFAAPADALQLNLSL
ncbi:MAG: hypothetical protein AAGH48_00285 [Pseudomonadota bacterium]